MSLFRSLLVLLLVIALSAPALAQEGNYGGRGGGGGYRGGGGGMGFLPGLLLGAAAAAAGAAAHERDEERLRRRPHARRSPPDPGEFAPPHRRRPLHHPPIDVGEIEPLRHHVHPHRVAPVVEQVVARPAHRARPDRIVAARPEPSRALPPPPGETRLAPDEILVAFKARKAGDRGPDFARAQNLAYVQARALNLIGVTVHRLRLRPGADLRRALRKAGRDPDVAWVQPNYLYQLQQPTPTLSGALTPAPAPAPAAGGYVGAALNLGEAHRLFKGQGVAVAVIDSLIDAGHPELAGAIAEKFDALGAGAAPHGHGTAMAGAIAGHVKLDGAAPAARLFAVRAFDPSGAVARGSGLDIAAGLDWAADKGAKVVNMSFAGPADPLLEKMVTAAAGRGMALIAAAGNEGPRAPPQYPAAYAQVIAVAAVDDKARIYDRANRGAHVKLAAPGVDVLAAAPNGGYDLSTGTSIACAEISGVAALLLEKNPNLDSAALRRILRDTAHGLAGEAELGEADAAAAVRK